MINDPGFVLHLHQNLGFKNTDVDLIQLNVRYSLSEQPPELGPTPFLELPWDYGDKSFNDLVLDPNSWFDHQYPLQNVPCCTQQVLSYAGFEINDSYRSHSGYDYGYIHGVELNTPVLAAAAGWATYKPESKSGGAGNMIKIDHENGYQTWYEHLSSDELIVSNEVEKVHVVKGQKIGRVGMTGNTDGPHIHLSVFKDANENGTFDDDYPYGLVDPLGWEGRDDDPWTIREVEGRVGADSYNLFIDREVPKSVQIPSTGGSLMVDEAEITVPNSATLSPFTLSLTYGPYIITSSHLKSIMPSLSLSAEDSIGSKITQFVKPVSIVIHYKDSSLFNINEDTLKIYYLDEQTGLWEPIPSMLDISNNVISAQTMHFSHFAVMGELLDTTAPTTEVDIAGEMGIEGWYRTGVSVKLIAEDNVGGVGLGDTIYSINGSDWSSYIDPILLTDEGSYEIQYMSLDKADNREQKKTVEFNLDFTQPVVSTSVDPLIIWPPNGRMVNIQVNGDSFDENLESTKIGVEDEYDSVEPQFSEFGSTIQLEASRKGNDTDGRQYRIQAIAQDKAGNISSDEVTVLVPHDIRE